MSNEVDHQGPIEPAVLGLIPARGGSKGVPGKNTRLLAGKPLICHSCDTAKQCQHITRTIVSTDCPQIAEVAAASGAEIPFLRPAALATDTSPTLDTIKHALDWLDEHESWKPEFVVLLQPTAPLRTASDVDRVVDKLITSKADSVVSVCRVESHYHPAWQLRMDGGELMKFDGGPVDAIPIRRQLLDTTYVRNGAIYAIRRETILNDASIYGRRCLAYEMPQARSVNIDTLDDFCAAETYLNEQDAELANSNW